MSALVAAPWLGVVLPIFIALCAVVVGRWSRLAVPVLAAAGPSLVMLIGAGSLVRIAALQSAGTPPWTSPLASAGSMPWLSAGGAAFRIGWAVDSLAAVMLVVVGFVALMVVVFSAGYMAEDRGWARYFALLSAFTGAMTLLVIADSFTTLFIGWELVGACSYLLIGFWYDKPSAAAAAIKAFLTTRVGDVGLLAGLAILWTATGSLGFTDVMAGLPAVPQHLITAAAVLVAVGAIGKSAQFPLHIWLPDAMEGPTPVSALIHAATMVAAGVYLIARTWPLFELSLAAQSVLLGVGLVSAFGAALFAVAQTDIKKVLAYSTISQLGFMFCALGVGAWEVAFFHLVTHAAFKSLLFLASGSVIHGSGTQDLGKMGGLRRRMPVTYLTWVVGSAALIGVWPMAGFFSKDAVIDAVWLASPGASVPLFAAVVLTGLYTVRATKLAFFGVGRSSTEAHESPLSMLLPLVVLSIPAALLGLAGGWLAHVLGAEAEPLSLPISAVALSLGLAGGALGWFLTGREGSPYAVAGLSERSAEVLQRGLGYDGAVTRLLVRPVVGACRGIWAIVDRLVIDGLVEGSALLARTLSVRVSRWQSGDGQAYATMMVIGVVVIVCAIVLVGR